jgi:hypothetical protein
LSDRHEIELRLAAIRDLTKAGEKISANTATFLLDEVARLSDSLDKAWDLFSDDDQTGLANHLNDARHPSKQKAVNDFIEGALSPSNIGELRKAIQFLKDDLVVFRFQYGNLDGMCDWRHKKTWRQWCREQKL